MSYEYESLTPPPFDPGDTVKPETYYSNLPNHKQYIVNRCEWTGKTWLVLLEGRSSKYSADNFSIVKKKVPSVAEHIIAKIVINVEAGTKTFEFDQTVFPNEESAKAHAKNLVKANPDDTFAIFGLKFTAALEEPPVRFRKPE